MQPSQNDLFDSLLNSTNSSTRLKRGTAHDPDAEGHPSKHARTQELTPDSEQGRAGDAVLLGAQQQQTVGDAGGSSGSARSVQHLNGVEYEEARQAGAAADEVPDAPAGDGQGEPEPLTQTLQEVGATHCSA